MDENEKTRSPGKVYELLIKHRVRINDQKDVKGVYDTGANARSINQKIIDQIKADLTEHKSVFKIISSNDFTSGRAKLRMKINKIEEIMDVFMVRNDKFTYHLVLWLDAIKSSNYYKIRI